jgi:hypothetical protein
MMGRRTDGEIRYTSTGKSRRLATEQILLIVSLSITGCILIAVESSLPLVLPFPILRWQAASPALGLLFSMAVGFLHSEREGGITGLITGFLVDGAMGSGILLMPLLFFLGGYLSGISGRRRLAHNLPSFMVFSLVGGLLYCLFILLREVILERMLPSPLWIWQGLTPVWILTILVSPIPYLLVWGEKKILRIDQ